MVKKYRKKPVTIEAIQWNGKNINCIYEDLSNDIKIKPFGLAYKFTIQECDKALKELEE